MRELCLGLHFVPQSQGATEQVWLMFWWITVRKCTSIIKLESESSSVVHLWLAGYVIVDYVVLFMGFLAKLFTTL